MPVQQRNSEMVDLLSADFQLRYEPNFAWKSAISACLALPALRVFWPMSMVDTFAATQAANLGGDFFPLRNVNVSTFGYDQLAPYAEFDGINQYLFRLNGGAANWSDVSGTEAYIVAAQRGLTFGGWFLTDTIAAGNAIFVSQEDVAGATYDYRIRRAAAVIAGSINVAAPVAVNSSVALTTGDWFFIVLRFTPATSLDIFVNGTWDTQATALAAIVDSLDPFNVGGEAGGDYLDGKASLVWLCGAAHSDAIVSALYQQTRAMFGV